MYQLCLNSTYHQGKIHNSNPLFAPQTQAKPQDFESVFDMLRLLEHKQGQPVPRFKFKQQEVVKQRIQMKINFDEARQQQQYRLLQESNPASHLSAMGEDGTLLSPKAMTIPKHKCGWLYYIKNPSSCNGVAASQKSANNSDSSNGVVLDKEEYQRIMRKRFYFIFRKGKLYQFFNDQAEKTMRVLDIRNCMLDLVTIHRKEGDDSENHLDQAIELKSLGQTYYFFSGIRINQLSSAFVDYQHMHGVWRDTLIQWYNMFKPYCTLMNLKSYYEIGNLLGKGNFAKVYEAIYLENREKFALKTIEKKVLSKCKRNFLALLQEVTLLRKLDHQNIIKLHEVYESKNNVHIILEHLSGGELFERIRQKGQYSEGDASIIMRCLLMALVAMHSKQIVHRDLKPENMLFKNESIDSLKIVDFGLSASVKEGMLTMRCGSPGYVAPEILNDLGYNCKADIFSAGIILYILLTGKFVFSGKNYKEILQKNKECIVPYPPQYWNRLSHEAKDLVQQMLAVNPENRLSAFEALQHPWFGLYNPGNAPNLLQISFEEVGEANLTDDEPSLANSVNLQLVTTSPIWNKTKMRDQLRRINLEQDKQITFQTPAANPRFGFQAHFTGGQRFQALVGAKSAINPHDRYSNLGNPAPGVGHKIISGGLVIQSIMQPPPQFGNKQGSKGVTGLVAASPQDVIQPTKQLQIQHDLIKKKYMQTPQIHPNIFQHSNLKNDLESPSILHHKNQLSLGLSQKSNINKNTEYSSNVNHNNLEEEKNGNKYLNNTFSLSQSHNKVMAPPPEHTPDIDRIMKKWQEQPLHNQLDKVPEDQDEMKANSYNALGGATPSKEIISSVGGAAIKRGAESSQFMQSDSNIKQNPLVIQIKDLSNVAPQTSSDDSSISGPIDIEENLTIMENNHRIVDFNAHSNKSLLQKVSARTSSPLFVSAFNNHNINNNICESGGSAKNSQNLTTQKNGLLPDSGADINNNWAWHKKHRPQLFNQQGNPTNLQPALQLSSASPINSRVLIGQNGFATSGLLQKDSIDDQPIGNNNPSCTEVTPFSNLIAPPNLQQHKLQPSFQRGSQFRKSDEPSKQDTLNTFGDEDLEEGIDNMGGAQNQGMIFVVPSTPGALQGGSRNLLKNSLNNKLAAAPLLKYTQSSGNQALLIQQIQEERHGSNKKPRLLLNDNGISKLWQRGATNAIDDKLQRPQPIVQEQSNDYQGYVSSISNIAAGEAINQTIIRRSNEPIQKQMMATTEGGQLPLAQTHHQQLQSHPEVKTSDQTPNFPQNSTVRFPGGGGCERYTFEGMIIEDPIAQNNNNNFFQNKNLSGTGSSKPLQLSKFSQHNDEQQQRAQANIVELNRSSFSLQGGGGDSLPNNKDEDTKQLPIISNQLLNFEKGSGSIAKEQMMHQQNSFTPQRHLQLSNIHEPNGAKCKTSQDIPGVGLNGGSSGINSGLMMRSSLFQQARSNNGGNSENLPSNSEAYQTAYQSFADLQGPSTQNLQNNMNTNNLSQLDSQILSRLQQSQSQLAGHGSCVPISNHSSKQNALQVVRNMQSSEVKSNLRHLSSGMNGSGVGGGDSAIQINTTCGITIGNQQKIFANQPSLTKQPYSEEMPQDSRTHKILGSGNNDSSLPPAHTDSSGFVAPPGSQHSQQDGSSAYFGSQNLQQQQQQNNLQSQELLSKKLGNMMMNQCGGGVTVVNGGIIMSQNSQPVLSSANNNNNNIGGGNNSNKAQNNILHKVNTLRKTLINII